MTQLARAGTAASVAAVALFAAGCGPNLFNRISNFWSLSCCGVVVVILDVIALLEIAQSARSTSDKILWAALIVLFPILGFVVYYFFARK